MHYIRCIKPNEAKVAWEFDGPMVLSQLRACGVLETIRISCLGYPSRWTFEEFAERYYALVPSKQWETNDIRSLCQLVLDSCIKDTDKYQIGETKIFFRAGQLAYMEKLRSDRYDACAIVLQKNMRRFVYRRRYVRLQTLIIQLQCLARQKLAAHKLQELRQNKAAIIIQTNFRRYIAHKAFVSKKDFIIRLQTGIFFCTWIVLLLYDSHNLHKPFVAVKHAKYTRICKSIMLLYRSNVMPEECK